MSRIAETGEVLEELKKRNLIPYYRRHARRAVDDRDAGFVVFWREADAAARETIGCKTWDADESRYIVPRAVFLDSLPLRSPGNVDVSRARKEQAICRAARKEAARFYPYVRWRGLPDLT